MASNHVATMADDTLTPSGGPYDNYLPPKSLDDYQFPYSRLMPATRDSSRRPLLLVACGSFSPPTYLHLRMFEMAADFVKRHTNFEVIGGYLSPVSDAYKKIGLANAKHRMEMCNLAVTRNSDWLMLDPWEAVQKEYQPTAKVLDHFADAMRSLRREDVHVALLAGADLIHSMLTPGLWNPKDLEHILGRYGTFIIERAGTDITIALDALHRWNQNIHLIPQPILNDVSSTKIRLAIKQSLSIRYLVPQEVIEYIRAWGLYRE